MKAFLDYLQEIKICSYIGITPKPALSIISVEFGKYCSLWLYKCNSYNLSRNTFKCKSQQIFYIIRKCYSEKHAYVSIPVNLYSMRFL